MRTRPTWTGIYVGATQDTVAAARAAIMDILNTEKAGDGPKAEALKTLATLCNVNHTTISNVEIRGPK